MWNERQALSAPVVGGQAAPFTGRDQRRTCSNRRTPDGRQLAAPLFSRHSHTRHGHRHGRLPDPARRHQEGLLHRRGGDARALRDPPRHPAWRVRGHRRALGMRQDHAALDPGAARLADRRHLHPRRPAGGAADRLGARPGPQPADRVHLPGLQSDRRPHRLRERRATAHLPRHADATSGGAGCSRRWSGWGCRTG